MMLTLLLVFPQHFTHHRLLVYCPACLLCLVLSHQFLYLVLDPFLEGQLLH